MAMKLEDVIGYAVIFLFIALAWAGHAGGVFTPDKALFMALVGLPLGCLAPAFLARENR